MISLKAPHNNLMPYTQQSILNTVKNNQLPEDIKSSLVSCVDIFKVLIKQYYDYPYDCRDDLVDDDKLICGVVINSGRSSCSLVEPASLVWRGVW